VRQTWWVCPCDSSVTVLAVCYAECFLLLIFDIIQTVVLIRYIYLLEISVKHNNYCRSYSYKIRTTCFGLNRPSSGPQGLNYVLCNIFVNYAMGSHLHCSVNNCFKTKIKLQANGALEHFIVVSPVLCFVKWLVRLFLWSLTTVRFHLG
jgi:hypothetical protein